MTQKASRLMHAIMATAVEDEVSRGHPCRVKGVGQEHSDERLMSPIATLGSGGVGCDVGDQEGANKGAADGHPANASEVRI